MSYVNPIKAAEIYGVSTQTLRRWANNGQILFKVTNGKHRRYKIPDRVRKGKKIIYARVSSKKQEGDLTRQIKYLKEKYPKYTVISDIGSGLNFKRKGLKTILEQLFERNIEEVVVYAKDRLSRFGIKLFEYMFEFFGAKLTFTFNEDKKSNSEELAEDIMAILTVYAARLHGRRKYEIQ